MFRGGYRGRGGSSSSRGGRGGHSVARLRGLFADGVWHCDCAPRLPAEHFKVKKEGKNQGRWFYTCQMQEDKRCGFFLWDEDAKPRETAAVLNNSRSEPGALNVPNDAQEGWSAGRGASANSPAGKGLFAGVGQRGAHRVRDDDQEILSPSPPPPYSSPSLSKSTAKRTARDADIEEDDDDDDLFPWPLTGQEEAEMARAADSLAPETPHKAQKTGVYATPATNAKRKLPWLEQPITPAMPIVEEAASYFDTPSRSQTSTTPTLEAETTTPRAPPVLSTAAPPAAASRYRDALDNPADSRSSLTSEALAALSTTVLQPATLSSLRSILSRHDLKTTGITKGRDISRLAIKAKDAKLAELQAKITSLEAERELDRSVIRQLRWEAQYGQRIDDDL